MDSSFKLTGAPIGIALVAALLLGGVEAGATVPDDLCTGDPCVIPETVVVDDGSDLDFGDRDLIVARDVEIIVDGWGEDIHFEARSIVFEPGSRVRAKTPGEYGLKIGLYAQDGNVELQADGNKRVRFEMSGTAEGQGGDLEVYASNYAGDASALLDGVVQSRGGVGGEVSIYADGNVRIADIDTKGLASVSGGGLGGFIDIESDEGDIEVTGTLQSGANGRSGEGENQHLNAEGSIYFRPGSVVDVSSTGPESVTGILWWRSKGGDIVFAGRLNGTTPSSLESTEAAFVYADAHGSITISGPMDMAAGNNGYGYESDFTAGGDISILPGGWIKAGSRSRNGMGGGLTLNGRHISIQDDLDISGGGEGTGSINIEAELTVTIDADLAASATNGAYAGDIDIEACDVSVTSRAKLAAVSGSSGDIDLSGWRRVIVDGQIKAGDDVYVRYNLNYPELLGRISPTPFLRGYSGYADCADLATCGDGILDTGEQCDDGNLIDGDCCSAGCAAEAIGNACTGNWGLCAQNKCDGAGGCGIATPGAGCFLSLGNPITQLQLSDRSADRSDLLSFKWLRGQEVPFAALPDPVSGDDVDFCLYNSSGQPIFRAAAPGAGVCGNRACWRGSSTGYSYSDKERTPDGILKLNLKGGPELRGKADLKAKGENLPAMPALPLRLPVRAQLLSSNGTCWEATFGATGAIKNTGEQFKGRADAVCGDGGVGRGEACDDGNELDGDYCSADCKTITAICGDGEVGPGECCDDGNTIDDTDCSATCDSGELCPKCDLAPGHYYYCRLDQCGPCGLGEGNCWNNSQCEASLDCINDLGSDYGYPSWVNVCAETVCGDGLRQGRESCDDGNTLDGDYCSADCSAVTAVCGDGSRGVGEVCDDGNTEDGDLCSGDCTQWTPICGDGIVTVGEACDDSNTSDGDLCSGDCTQWTPICGDGIVTAGEACDDGNTDGSDYCSADCSTVTAICGDGTVSLDEACDDGNTDDGDLCSGDCTQWTPICGDEIVTVGEACDDGNTNDGDYCSADCSAVTTVCGDGVVGTGEACDSVPFCASDCLSRESTCGDGVLTSGECCDDGNTVDGDSCSSTCDSGSACDGVCNHFPGDWDYCKYACGPCGPDLGDCDNNSECKSGTSCVTDVGTEYGWYWTVDVCR